ncbi:MAG TPA: CGNR zinc finger domain-containing protein [Steroidobacteraceae bacterium]|nr:CGNR zinc finger domain-containing protein [Steroidobacteraceae bacterium]
MAADPGANPAAPFDLSGGHPVLDFVNSLDNRFARHGPVELLGGYGDLLRFAEQSQLLDAQCARLLARSVNPAAAARALRAARELREALAAVLYGHLEGRVPATADLLVLERRFHDADRHRELRWEPAAAGLPGRARLQWQWGRSAKAADFPVWLMAHAASQLLSSPAMERMRACGAETCRWLFLDTSKNHTRRWCNMKVCGNRAKARRFQQRHAD